MFAGSGRSGSRNADHHEPEPVRDGGGEHAKVTRWDGAYVFCLRRGERFGFDPSRDVHHSRELWELWDQSKKMDEARVVRRMAFERVAGYRSGVERIVLVGWSIVRRGQCGAGCVRRVL